MLTGKWLFALRMCAFSQPRQTRQTRLSYLSDFMREPWGWNRAINQAALDKLRFSEGARLRIVAGPHEGEWEVEKFLRHFHA